jgi:hypothetical protein
MLFDKRTDVNGKVAEAITRKTHNRQQTFAGNLG